MTKFQALYILWLRHERFNDLSWRELDSTYHNRYSSTGKLLKFEKRLPVDKLPSGNQLVGRDLEAEAFEILVSTNFKNPYDLYECDLNIIDANIKNQLDKNWFLIQRHDNKKIEIVRANYKGLKDLSYCSHEYKTKSDLIVGEEIYPKYCKSCGGYIKLNFVEPVRTKLLKKEICFYCDFWETIEESLSSPQRVIIDGKSYWINPDVDRNTSFAGFGGAEFKIQKFDSEDIIVTHNLWHQGTVPDHFKERIKNNAKFIKDVK